MPKLDRYLSSEFARATLASLLILIIVSLGGVFADLIGEMALGKVPPALLLSQLGLRLLGYLPLILPLALLLGILLATGRLYRDSEMPVLATPTATKCRRTSSRSSVCPSRSCTKAATRSP